MMFILGLSAMVVMRCVGMRSILGLSVMVVGLSRGIKSTVGPTHMVRGSTRCCGEVGFVIVMGLMEEGTIWRV